MRDSRLNNGFNPILRTMTALCREYRNLFEEGGTTGGFRRSPLDDLVPIILGVLSDADKTKSKKIGEGSLKKDLIVILGHLRNTGGK